MMKFLENKNVRMAIIIIVVLILAGVVIGIALNGDKDKADKGDTGQNVIVHEKEDDTREESDEAGLIESDSEDGPMLKDEDIIDYSGGNGENSTPNSKEEADDASSKDNSDENNSDKDNSDKDNSDKDNSDKNDSDKDESDKDEGTKDTGSWGAFY